MQVTIQSQDFPMTESIERFVRKQVNQSMAACNEQINHLVVRLKSNRHSERSAEPQCCVEVHIPRQPTVVVIKRSKDTYSTIREAIARAGRTTLRQIKKRRGARSSQAGRNTPGPNE